MHKETKATKISEHVKDAVWARDGGFCILCGRPGDPHCHVVRRSAGGMGLEENIITLCPRCHYAFDEGLYMKELELLGFRSRAEIKAFIYKYMETSYPGWTPEKVIYRKWREFNAQQNRHHGPLDP